MWQACLEAVVEGLAYACCLSCDSVLDWRQARESSTSHFHPCFLSLSLVCPGDVAHMKSLSGDAGCSCHWPSSHRGVLLRDDDDDDRAGDGESRERQGAEQTPIDQQPRPKWSAIEALRDYK